MISVCAICHSRQKSEGVRIAQLKAENAKLQAVVGAANNFIAYWGKDLKGIQPLVEAIKELGDD
jgi:hypothetical protein